MKRAFLPQTTPGKWSVGLQTGFVIAVIVSIILVKVFGFNFDDRWWDITCAFAFPASIMAFIIGISAMKKQHERATAVIISVIIGIGVIIFLLLHSLFIND